MGEKSMLGDWVSTELETAHQYLEDDPFFGAYDSNFFEKVLKNIEMGDHQMQHALDELSAAQKRIADLEKMVDASMNRYECWNCGTRYERFQTEDHTCPACNKEPIDYRAKYREARDRIVELEAKVKDLEGDHRRISDVIDEERANANSLVMAEPYSIEQECYKRGVEALSRRIANLFV